VEWVLVGSAKAHPSAFVAQQGGLGLAVETGGWTIKLADPWRSNPTSGLMG